jgi:hypothetical protein
MNRSHIKSALFVAWGVILTILISKSAVFADPPSSPPVSFGVCDQGGNLLDCLAGVRAAIAQYYIDNKSKYPENLGQLVPKYATHIPTLWNGGHDEGGKSFPHGSSNEVTGYPNRITNGDSGTWGYVNDPASHDFGTVFIDCTHTDWRGLKWNSF